MIKQKNWCKKRINLNHTQTLILHIQIYNEILDE